MVNVVVSGCSLFDHGAAGVTKRTEWLMLWCLAVACSTMELQALQNELKQRDDQRDELLISVKVKTEKNRAPPHNRV